MRIAAQLYTLRNYTQTGDGFRESLRRCAGIGFAGVQLSAVGCMNGDSPEVDAKAARRWLDEFGLSCCATHRPWPSLAASTEEEVEFHKELGCDYTAVGSISGDFGQEPDSYRRFLEAAKPVAEKLKKAGIRFGYHNHSHEFIRDESTGKPCMEILVQEADWLQMEVDTYWVAHAGVCPADFLQTCSGRLPVIHVKDMEVVPKDGPVMAPVGEGNLCWESILSACRSGGTEWLVVEQDTCRRDPFECLTSSYKFLADHV